MTSFITKAALAPVAASFALMLAASAPASAQSTLTNGPNGLQPNTLGGSDPRHHRVDGGTAGVAEPPALDGALGWAGEDTRVGVVEVGAVDSPDVCAAHLEVELVVDGAALGGPGDVGVEGGGDGVVGGVADGVTNDEAHDFVRVGEFVNLSDLHAVHHGDVLAFEAREVDDDFVALAHGDDDVFGVDW